MPIEIKSGKTLTGESFTGLKKWLSLARYIGVAPTLLYGGEEYYRRSNIQVAGWRRSGDVIPD